MVCLKEQTVLQTLHTKNYFIQWWKNGKRSFANHINTRTAQQDFSKIHVQIICYEERFMVTHMPLFLYFNFLTNVFSFFYFIKIIKILLLLSFQLWSLYYTNKRQGPFELYNPFSHLLSQRLKTLSLENLNMAHLFSSQNLNLQSSVHKILKQVQETLKSFNGSMIWNHFCIFIVFG